MKESLGLNISYNFIRYAKIQNTGKKIIIKALGVKVYEGNPKAVISQIIKETNSENARISTNIINEEYYYSKIYTNKKINKKYINFEFSEYCKQNNIVNEETIGRYIFEKNKNQRKAIYIYNYTNLLYNVYKRFENPSIINTITPIATALQNLIVNNTNKNIIIINLEEIVSITTMIDRKIDGVVKFNHEMYEIFQKLMNQEPQFVKLYESIKNTTIPMENLNIQDEENNERLKLIIPLLYKITDFIKKVKNKYEKIDEIYLTGFGANINNIDIYFKNLFPETEIKILIPYFMPNMENKRKFTEYNAAISLAIEGLNESNTLNFCDEKFENKIHLKKKSSNIKFNLLLDCLTILAIFIIYVIGNILLNNQIRTKKEKVDNITNYSSIQIEKAKKDKEKIYSLITEYATAKSKSTTLEKKTKVNNLLNQIYHIIPKDIKLVEIKSIENKENENENENETDNTQKFTIIVQSEEKASLQKFSKELENTNILKNIKISETDLDEKTKQASIEVEIK